MMLMAIKGKKTLFYTSIVIILLLFGIFILWNSKKKEASTNNTAQSENWNDDIQAQIRKSTEEHINDEEVLRLYDLLEAKEYNKVVELAKDLCPKKSGEVQLICYGQYGGALTQINNLPEFVVVAGEVLKTDSIKQNETAKKQWEYNLSLASQGINPKDKPLGGTGDEARL